MTEQVISGYSSDDDIIDDEQIQYTYVEVEIVPIIELVDDEIENHNLGMVDIEEYERVRDQAEELSGQNWELAFKCKNYERDLRILKRTMPTRIKDKIRFWKEVAAIHKQRVKTWIKHLIRCSTEEDVIYYRTPQYKGMLEARYYRPELNPE